MIPSQNGVEFFPRTTTNITISFIKFLSVSALFCCVICCIYSFPSPDKKYCITFVDIISLLSAEFLCVYLFHAFVFGFSSFSPRSRFPMAQSFFSHSNMDFIFLYVFTVWMEIKVNTRFDANSLAILLKPQINICPAEESISKE